LVEKLRAEYRKDIDLVRLASELIIDDIVQPERLRSEIVRRVAMVANKRDARPAKKHMVPPV
jgi:acetyl-CoA carboxylase carboxyltransferase component